MPSRKSIDLRNSSISTESSTKNGRKSVEQLLKEHSESLVRIDIGGGSQPQDGWITMDIRDLPTTDIIHDWDDYPWPFPDSCASVLMAGHVVEHVNPAKFGFIKWMDECWRILKYEGQLVIATPFAGSTDYWADPTHCNGCNNHTWRYFDPFDEFGRPSELYKVYRPKPWQIKNLFWSVNGSMEVLLVKRHMDRSYEG